MKAGTRNAQVVGMAAPLCIALMLGACGGGSSHPPPPDFSPVGSGLTLIGLGIVLAAIIRLLGGGK